MGSIDDNGIYIYDETDRIAPLHTTLNLGASSVSAAISGLADSVLIRAVTTLGERDAYEQEMRDAGKPPSPSNPLIVNRGELVERNIGEGWHTIAMRDVTSSLTQYSSGWATESAVAHMRNGIVVFDGRIRRAAADHNIGNTFVTIGKVGGRFIPDRTNYYTVMNHDGQIFQGGVNSGNGEIRIRSLSGTQRFRNGAMIYLSQFGPYMAA